MAESQRMTTAEVVRKTLIDEHADFLAEAVAVVAAQLMEAEISTEIGAQGGVVLILEGAILLSAGALGMQRFLTGSRRFEPAD
jgi:hypothetical protein